MWLKSVYMVFLLIYHVESASILALFSSLSFTDHIVYRGYISLLAQNGHSIVVMTPYPGHFQFPEVEKIVELNVGPESASLWEEYKILMTNTDDYYPRLKALNELSIKVAIAQLMSKQMTSLFMNPNVKFDLVITEADMPILYAAADKYKAPHITITAGSGKLHQYEAKGNPIHPILYPDVNTIYHRDISSWQKLFEVNRQYHSKNEYFYNFLPLCDIAAKKILGLKRSLLDVEYDIDLLFVAGNPVLIGNRPTSPATVYTDRLHIKPGLLLPPDLKAVLDSAKNGVIYFSLGTLHESEQLEPKILEVLADTFRELPFLVLWKLGNTTIINKPDNVIAQMWFPQQEVLAHPNMKAFITHGGLRSLEEAVFYEVPIVGFPIVKSSKVFINEVTRHGTGETVDPYYLEKEALKSTIMAVAQNDMYKKAMAKLKSAAYDSFLSGPEAAVMWTEYVIRNGGARMLRAPAAEISFFKYYMLDIVSLLLIIICIGIYLAYKSLCYVMRLLRLRILRKPIAGGKYKAL
ncbi:PREDICTED: UDP-glucuronosyltransferase 2C1-like [Papilio xuthus]|uniref:UDP-glucuronosyltransferase 2C1-like n=1 Tax=Papilio xuthus TaxID=66420 RepID=A0AAJ6ZDW2_PAPXU|nr:PREDICTED: UDP-glucuronosyltransferase 2C1-like [Papilio xuthus]